MPNGKEANALIFSFCELGDQSANKQEDPQSWGQELRKPAKYTK